MKNVKLFYFVPILIVSLIRWHVVTYGWKDRWWEYNKGWVYFVLIMVGALVIGIYYRYRKGGEQK